MVRAEVDFNNFDDLEKYVNNPDFDDSILWYLISLR